MTHEYMQIIMHDTCITHEYQCKSPYALHMNSRGELTAY